MHGIRQAAKLAGISEALLALWLETGRIKPTTELGPAFGSRGCCFDDEAVEQIRRLAENGQSDKSRDGSSPSAKSQRRGRSTPPSPNAEFLTVAQVAERWGLSVDTIT